MSATQVLPDDLSQPTKKGITISKTVGIIIITCIAVSFAAVIIGLSVGLKDAYKTDCTKQSDTQKYEICQDLSCRNISILQSELIFKLLKETFY